MLEWTITDKAHNKSEEHRDDLRRESWKQFPYYQEFIYKCIHLPSGSEKKMCRKVWTVSVIDGLHVESHEFIRKAQILHLLHLKMYPGTHAWRHYLLFVWLNSLFMRQEGEELSADTSSTCQSPTRTHFLSISGSALELSTTCRFWSGG